MTHKMNPWANGEVQDLDTVDNNLNSLTFEDNFTLCINEGLPDSKEYLDCLENKLRKLKSGANVLQQLSARREDCMHQLLTQGANISTDENLSLDDPINSDSAAQQLIRNIYPERQALTVGELVNIINHDYLEKENQEEAESDPNQPEK